MRLPFVVAVIATTLALPTVASAIDAPSPSDDAIVTLGGGVKWEPDWEGSKTYLLSPVPIVGLKFLRSPLTGAATTDTGFGIAPSFRYLSSRSFGAGSPLFGLRDVGTAFEAGLTVDYTDRYWRAFVTARQGMGGHHGQVAEIGVDGILRPMDRLTIEAGPRLLFASADYMRTYYGVPTGSVVPAYDPGGGYRGAGLAGRATWEFDRGWFARADASWTRLADRITASPIVQTAGARDQFSVGVGLGWRFGVNWH